MIPAARQRTGGRGGHAGAGNVRDGGKRPRVYPYVWPDCNPGDWFYLAVQEATNSHDYKHKAGNYETWSSMNKDPDWTRYEN